MFWGCLRPRSSSVQLPDLKHLRVSRFLPLGPRCSNIITAVKNRKIKELQLCALQHKSDEQMAKTHHPVGHAVNLLPEQSVYSGHTHTQGHMSGPCCLCPLITDALITVMTNQRMSIIAIIKAQSN